MDQVRSRLTEHPNDCRVLGHFAVDWKESKDTSKEWTDK